MLYDILCTVLLNSTDTHVLYRLGLYCAGPSSQQKDFHARYPIKRSGAGLWYFVARRRNMLLDCQEIGFARSLEECRDMYISRHVHARFCPFSSPFAYGKMGNMIKILTRGIDAQGERRADGGWSRTEHSRQRGVKEVQSAYIRHIY